MINVRIMKKELAYWTKKLNEAKNNNRKIEIFNASSHVSYLVNKLKKYNRI